MRSLPKTVERWIKKHITKPIRGFEHKLNKESNRLTIREQQEATYKQLYFIVRDMVRRGKNKRQILKTLNYFR